MNHPGHKNGKLSNKAYERELRRLQAQDVERRPRAETQPLALPNSKVVNPLMVPDHFARSGDQLARRVGHLLALLIEIGVDKLLVIAGIDGAGRATGPRRPRGTIRAAAARCGCSCEKTFPLQNCD